MGKQLDEMLAQMTLENTQLKMRLSKVTNESKSASQFLANTNATLNQSKKSRKESMVSKKNSNHSSVYGVPPEDLKNPKQVTKTQNEELLLSPNKARSSSQRKSLMIGRNLKSPRGEKQPSNTMMRMLSKNTASGSSQQDEDDLNYTNEGIMDLLKQKTIKDSKGEINNFPSNEFEEEEG